MYFQKLISIKWLLVPFSDSDQKTHFRLSGQILLDKFDKKLGIIKGNIEKIDEITTSCYNKNNRKLVIIFGQLGQLKTRQI